MLAPSCRAIKPPIRKRTSDFRKRCWKYLRNLESPSVISRLSQRFKDDDNVSRCYSTGHPRVTTPNEDRYIWQLLPKETDGAQHQTCLVSSLQLPVRQFQGIPCTDAYGTLDNMLVGLSDVFHLPQLTVACD
ncbi:uncharacterized protein TNCV_2101411 [Trichonephila clavipes]|nr:uncharacterized protein TNCV_2101411 [Trichonephila clavipes]